ncbi:MAG TPA: EAL domain-containing protein, partial [Gammaproteobacteria bacterium]|nr:EAL domain-containing protein [Gammaproteobacteria bacterium]
TVTALAHALGMRVVAEGVDSAEAVAAVAALECDMAQGFFIGRPMRGDLVVDWMAHYSSAAMRRGSVVRTWREKAETLRR